MIAPTMITYDCLPCPALKSNLKRVSRASGRGLHADP